MINNLHLTVSPYDHPSRILKETESLVRGGVVDAVHIAALQQDGEPEREEIDCQRTIWRVRLLTRNWSKRLFVQAFKLLEYSVRVTFLARRHNIKMINVHNVAALPLGVFLKWICGAELVYDTHELETETFGKNRIHKIVSKLFERTLIRQARLVIVVGDAIKKWYEEEYGLNNVVTAMNCPKYRAPRKTNLIRSEQGIGEDKKIVIYQGGLWHGRGIEQLLEAFAQMEDDRFVLVCMGFGELSGLIASYQQRHDNIYLQKSADPSEVLEYTSSADFGVAYIDNPSLNDQYCLPNKFFEYIMSGLPVLVNDAPEMRRIVEAYGIGQVLTELTAESVPVALDALVSLGEETLRSNLEKAGTDCAWENQACRMLEAYNEHVIPNFLLNRQSA